MHFNRTHGHRSLNYTSPTYHSWASMKARCQCKTNPAYPQYGGRGIQIDPRWGAFSLFLEDMGEKPAKGWSIERSDVNGNYTKTNCVWALPAQQARNRRNNKNITWQGRTQTEAEWAAEYGISRGRLHYRLGVGIPMEQALRKEHRQTGVPSKKYVSSASSQPESAKPLT